MALDIIELRSTVSGPKFLEHGVLLDKFQQYPLPAGLYDVKVVKTFTDKRGDKVLVVRLTPHQHHYDRTCTCKCGATDHEFVQGPWIKNNGQYTSCAAQKICRKCGEVSGMKHIDGPHKWVVDPDKPLRTCSRCGDVGKLPSLAWEALKSGRNLEDVVPDVMLEPLRRLYKDWARWTARLEALGKLDACKAAIEYSPDKLRSFKDLGLVYKTIGHGAFDYFAYTPEGKVYNLIYGLEYAGRDEDGHDMDDEVLRQVVEVPAEELSSSQREVIRAMQDPEYRAKVQRTEALIKRACSLRAKYRRAWKARYADIVSELQNNMYYAPYSGRSELNRLVRFYDDEVYF